MGAEASRVQFFTDGVCLVRPPRALRDDFPRAGWDHVLHDVLLVVLRWLLLGLRRELRVVEPADLPELRSRELRGHVHPRLQPAVLPELQVKDHASIAGTSVASAGTCVPVHHPDAFLESE